MNQVFCAATIFLGVVCAMKEKKPFASPSNSELDTFHTYAPSDTSDFRTLTIGSDKKTLFVGARQKVFGKVLSDIRQDAFRSIVWPSTKKNDCAGLPQSASGTKCHNLIQVIVQMNDTHVLICGTDSMSPKNKLLVRENTDSDFVLEHRNVLNLPVCSFDPLDTVTSVIVPTSDGSRNVVSTQRSLSDSISSLMKQSLDSPTLLTSGQTNSDKPQYVTSFSEYDRNSSHAMRKVYTVSYETASEMSPASTIPKPTITQLCANDVGGKNILNGKWTSLLKLRLQCATVDEKYPLKFDLVSDMVRGSGDILYGTFMTSHETARSNAVCSFRLGEIQAAFSSGHFYNTKSKPYVKVPPSEVSALSPYRPGMCAYSGMDPDDPTKSTSKDFPENLLRFMNDRFLVNDTVKPAFPSTNASSKPSTNGPLFVKAGEKFTKIAVQKVSNLTGAVHDVLFVGRSNGQIHKLFSIDKGDSIETIELATLKPSSDPILSMALSQEKEQLYIGTETALYQLSTSNCKAYTKSCEFCDPCHMCVLSRDPGCGWDTSAEACVSVKSGDKSNIKQDIYYGETSSQCKSLGKATPSPQQASKGATAPLGHRVTNPTVTVQWYKYDKGASGTKRRVLDVADKYRIDMEGRLQIMNFDPDTDSAVYECEYSAGSTTLNVSLYKLSATGDKTPTVTVPPPVKPTISSGRNTTGDSGPGVPRPIETTQSPPGSLSNSVGLIAGLAVALAVVLIFVVAVGICFKRRNKKYSPSREKKSNLKPEAMPLPSTTENRSGNNNTGLGRTQSEFDDRAHRPLLRHNPSDVSNVDVESAKIARTPSQRNARSMDNILNNRDDIQYMDADNDSDSTEDKRPTRQSSMRETSGRQRVPPARTKSMPGSALYVVYGGQKLKCSTLQRNKQGAWTIQVEPNQSGMLEMATDQDEIIDIINDDGTRVEERFLPSPENKASRKSREDARKAFFDDNHGGSNPSRSPSVNYVTSPYAGLCATQKPKVAPKPPDLLERAASVRKPIAERPSRTSLQSSDRNSSEDRDSDSTMKGSLATLRADESRTSLSKSSPSYDVAGEAKSATPSGSKAGKNRFDPLNSNRLSGGSDADEQLHGRDTRSKSQIRNLPDSPSKQSRTSHSSSSSGDYKSARSSVVSEATNEQR